jgi:hypothetical protein
MWDVLLSSCASDQLLIGCSEQGRELSAQVRSVGPHHFQVQFAGCAEGGCTLLSLPTSYVAGAESWCPLSGACCGTVPSRLQSVVQDDA